jgi:menaquinone-dependent protoporphyrinogen IX oxidase
MITDDREYAVALERIVWFQQQVAHLRRSEPNPANYRAAVVGFLAELDRMQREVREFLSLHPTELATVA